MNISRRALIATSAATVPLGVTGCLGDTTDTDGNGDDDDNGDNGDAGDCEDVELPETDIPPHDPERPEIPDSPEDEDDWDDHHLADGMETETDVSFERVNVRLDQPLDPVEYGSSGVYEAMLLETGEAFTDIAEFIDDDFSTDDVDWDEQAVIVVATGFGSSSVSHEWARVDDNCHEYHLHGYFKRPYITTDDVTSHTSAVVVETSDESDLERLWVSLTVSEETRVNFPTDGDRVVLGDENGDNGNDDGEGVDVQSVQVNAKSPGGWDNESWDDTGVVVRLTEASEAEAIVRDSENLARFVEMADFAEEYVYLFESAGPDLCNDEIEIRDVGIDVTEREMFIRGDATVQDTSEEGEGCGEMIHYPAALVSVSTDTDVDHGEFRITDGWDDQITVEAISFAEFVQETNDQTE